MADGPDQVLDDATLDALLGDVGAGDSGTDTGATDQGADNAGEWTPPTREEWEAAQAKITRANNNAKNLRLKMKGTPSPADMPGRKADAGETDPDKIRAAIEASVKAEYDAKQERASVESSAVTALVAAGLTLPQGGDRLGAVRRAVRLLDLDAVTVDGGGLEDAIAEVRDQFPGLFSDGTTGQAGAGKPRRRLDSAPRGAQVQAKSHVELLRDLVFHKGD